MTDFAANTRIVEFASCAANARQRAEWLKAMQAVEKKSFPKRDNLSDKFESEVVKRGSHVLLALGPEDAAAAPAPEAATKTNARHNRSSNSSTVSSRPASQKQSMPDTKAATTTATAAHSSFSASELSMQGLRGFLIFSNLDALGRILKVAVHPGCRRQGVGIKLMNASLEYLQQQRIPLVRLHVDLERSAAMGLYAQLGFSVACLVKNYYEPGRDAYLMEKRLIEVS